MGKSIKFVAEFKVEVKVPLSGASADELALSIGRVRNEMGRELMRLAIEAIQEVNDLAEAFPGSRLNWTIRSGGRKIEGTRGVDVPPLDAVRVDVADLRPVLGKEGDLHVELGLSDSKGRPLSRYSRTLRIVPEQ